MRKLMFCSTAVLLTAAFLLALPTASVSEDIFRVAGQVTISLPNPSTDGEVSVEKALSLVKPEGSYSSDPLSLQQVSQILWAAGRVSSSQDSCQLDVYLLAGRVKAIQTRVYKYEPAGHKLILEHKDDSIEAFYEAVGQKAAKEAPACLIVTMNPKKASEKLGKNASKYAYLEAGHTARSVCLDAAAMGLSTITLADFNTGKVKKALALPEDEIPLYVMPVGKGK